MRRSALVMAAIMVLGTVAFAAPALADGQRPDVAGRGYLAAGGRGTVHLDMGGKLTLSIRGDVRIVDVAGDAQIFIEGTETTGDSTTVVLENFEGTVKVRGSHFHVAAKGRMRFLARGRGHAHLDGYGWFMTGTKHGRWHGRVAFS